MIFIIFAIFYFLLIRPQQVQRRQHEKRLKTLKKGDRVLTTGGILGTIIGVKDNIAVVKIAENVKVEVQKSAITAVLEEETKE
jgi:preprotein translocase subunit YajC